VTAVAAQNEAAAAKFQEQDFGKDKHVLPPLRHQHAPFFSSMSSFDVASNSDIAISARPIARHVVEAD
jgi:hypothetical protein